MDTNKRNGAPLVQPITNIVLDVLMIFFGIMSMRKKKKNGNV